MGLGLLHYANMSNISLTNQWYKLSNMDYHSTPLSEEKQD